ncbi:MAG: hypothetical protein QXK06_02550, partial [Candidatus Diapherotrites archaeon]
ITLFSCFSNSTDWFTKFNGKAEMELKTESGKTIGKAEYSGEITPKIIAIKKELTADNEYDKLFLTSKIYGSTGSLDQEITIVYDFSKFNTKESYKKYVLPLIDKDLDGILNEEDECPEAKGTIENKGCPTATQTPTPVQTQPPKPTVTPEPKPDLLLPVLAIAVLAVLVLLAFSMMKKKKKEV